MNRSVIALTISTILAFAAAKPAVAEESHRFEIAAADSSEAVREFSRQTGMQVLVAGELLLGRRLNAVSGEHSNEEAMNLLLQGSGLTHKYVGERGMVIVEEGKKEKEGEKKLRVSQANTGVGTEAERGQRPESTEGPKLEEIVVTAQKREESLQRVPMSISVLTGPDLDRSTGEGITEALNSVPGVATQQNYLGGGTVVVIRGVAPAFSQISGSSPVAYYLDSVPFGLVKSAIAPDSNAYDLQRVEVLRGPQGTLYGASALNGVVRVLTQDASLDELEFKARTSISSTQYGGENYRADAAVNVPLIEDKLGARAVLGYQNLGGWIDQPNNKNANDAEIRNLRLKLNGKLTDQLSVGLSAWFSRSDFGAPPVGYEFDKNASVLDQPTSTDYDVYGATVKYQFPSVLLSSSTGYLKYANEGTLGLDVAPFGVPTSIYFTGEDSNVFSEELNLSSSTEGPWSWSVGGIYRRATETRTTLFTMLPVPTQVVDDISKSYAVFGELTRHLLDNCLDLTVGVRHFHDKVTQETQLGTGTPLILADTTAKANTPRGVLTWHASDDQTLYASYSQGFRSGFPQDVSVPADAGIPAARPDRLRNYELGSKGRLGDRISYDASFYYMDWRHIQLPISVFSEIYQQYTAAVVNSKSASGIGVDLALAIEPMDALTLKASLSWNNLELDSEVTSGGSLLFAKGDRPNSSPETMAGGSAAYTFPLGAVGYTGTFLAAVNYTSMLAYRAVGNVSEPVVQKGDPMTLVRTSFTIHAPRNWALTVYGDNLNNEKGAPVRAFAGAPNWDARVRPRTVGLQLEYGFQ